MIYYLVSWLTNYFFMLLFWICNMNKLTTVFKALSDKNRLRALVALLKYNELCACQIIELLKITGATTSRHMNILISSGLVCSRKEGRWVYYRICREHPEFNVLTNWIESQLANDKETSLDAQKLEEILSCNQEELCKRQRSKRCCSKFSKDKKEIRENE